MQENNSYISSKGVISRRNQNGTVVLMKIDDSSLFFKIEGVAAAVWAELDTRKSEMCLREHFAGLFPAQAGALAEEIHQFLALALSKGLVKEEPGESTPFRTETFLPKGWETKEYCFGGLKEFNLEQIETEVLNESIYLDVFAGSDLRLKDEMAPLENALAKVLQLQGINYRWKEETGKNTSLRAGLVAQDVASVMPELVRKDAGTGLLAVEYSKLNSYLVEAVKDLHRVIATQEARILDLEKRLTPSV